MTRKHLNQKLKVGSFSFGSRLILGTGKYKSLLQTKNCIKESGTELVTVAVRRINIGQDKNSENILNYLPDNVSILPNTAGCYTAKDAVRTLMLARELLNGHSLVKLEVIGDKTNLFPDATETIKAAKSLKKENFTVMVYTSDDPITAKKLEDVGCDAIMPLASLIGSGMGIINPFNLEIILREINVPVIVDAGVGTASDAMIAMEMGCDGVLVNTAIAKARDPVLMSIAMRNAVIFGRYSNKAGRMPKKMYIASPSSPERGTIGHKK